MRYALLILLLTSCSAEYHIKRALKKDKTYRNAIVETYLDSFIVITEGAKADTIFKYKPSKIDTFVLERDKFRTVVITDTLWRELYVDTECYPDTVEVVREVPVTVLRPEVNTQTWFQRQMAGIGKYVSITLLILVLFAILWGFYKRS